MLKRDMADILFSMALERYRTEKPTIELTNERMDQNWYSIYGVLNHYGEDAAYEYVRSSKLLEDK